MRLEKKVAFVTGGTSGIGKATVMRLVKEGANVVFTGRKEEAAKTITEETGATFIKHDVTDEAGYENIANEIKSNFGRLDIAFANAGTEMGDADIENISLENWNNLLAINLTGVMLTARMAIGVMKKNPDGPTGSIILNSSMTAHKPLSNFITYSTAKGAHASMAKSVATHCAGSGYKIRCNVIHPGVVETEMISAIISGAPEPEAARAQFNAMAQLNRMASVDEIAGLVVYLGSDEAGFISGASYNIDGASTAGMMGV